MLCETSDLPLDSGRSSILLRGRIEEIFNASNFSIILFLQQQSQTERQQIYILDTETAECCQTAEACACIAIATMWMANDSQLVTDIQSLQQQVNAA